RKSSHPAESRQPIQIRRQQIKLALDPGQPPRHLNVILSLNNQTRLNLTMKHSMKSPKQEQAQDQGNGQESDLHDLFLDELADTLSAEKQLTKALPKMAEAAESDELREAIESHLEETKQQVNRLEQVFKSLDETPRTKKCKGMEGILE